MKLGRYTQPLSVVFGSSPELVVLRVLMLSYFFSKGVEVKIKLVCKLELLSSSGL